MRKIIDAVLKLCLSGGTRFKNHAELRLEIGEVLKGDGPKVIVLSGSTRFIDVTAVAAFELEKAGHIVMSCHLLPSWYVSEDGAPVRPHHQAEAEGIDKTLDDLHLRKIDLAEELYVINVEGYIGESTQREIDYARKVGIRVVYLLEEILRGRAKWMDRMPRETVS